MTQAPNLFPDYPVASLGQPGLQTVTTPGIAKVNRLIDEFFISGASRQSRGVNIPVQGDFGTGKTHLLVYARDYLERRATSAGASTIVIELVGVQTTPDEWYRTAIGPQLVAARPEEMLFGVFADVAKTVALKAPLTRGAAAVIESDPASARTMVQQELLSPTSVDLELIERLEQIFGDVGDEIAVEVRRALMATVWSPAIADRWLRGETLLEEEQTATGLPPNVMTDDLASDAIIAFAAVASHTGRPFALMLDELEHFLRLDENEQTKRNVTWLKRLLERLIRCDAFVLVAGQTDVWRGHRDFLDRFTPGAEIELIPLDGDDVLRIVETIQGSLGTFDSRHAKRLAELSGGNMRRVLGMLHALSGRTSRFTTPFDDGDIEQVAATVTARVEPERAVEQVEELLADHFGLKLQREVRFAAGPQFDLVGYKSGSPRVAVEFQQAPFGRKQQGQVQRFIDKVRFIAEMAPTCVGCFISESPLDAGLREIVDASHAPIVLVDLTEPDFVESMRESLGMALAAEQPRGGDRPGSPDADLARLDSEIQALKEAQASFYDELQGRLASSGGTGLSAPAGVEFRSAPPEDFVDVRQRIYEEFTAPPPRARWLSQLVELRTLPALVALLVGAGLLAQSGSLATSAYTYDITPRDNLRVLLFIVGLLLVFGSIVFVARVYVLVERFYTFKRNVLREIYLRDDLPFDALVAANNLIENSFDRYGPRRGKRDAEWRLEQLGDQFGGRPLLSPFLGSDMSHQSGTTWSHGQ